MEYHPFAEVGPANFQWGTTDEKGIQKVVHWRRKIFLKVATGKASILFVSELSQVLRAYADTVPMRNITMKAIMTMPALLLRNLMPNPEVQSMPVAWKRD